MDPASIVGVIGASLELAKWTAALLKAVKKVYSHASRIDDDIKNLLDEIEGVQTLANTIEQHYKDYEEQKQKGAGLPEEGEQKLKEFWQVLQKQLNTGQDYILQQAKIVNGIAGTSQDDKVEKDDGKSPFSSVSNPPQTNQESSLLHKARDNFRTAKDKVDGFKKAYKLMSKEDDFNKISTRLHELHDRSWKLFMCVKDTEEKFTNSTNVDIRREVEIIRIEMQKFSADRAKLAELVQANKIDSPNLHFDLPHAASNIFTGRSVVMRMLEDAFFGPLPKGQRLQRRFVVQGQGGSGKTELCLQFAQRHRDRFWGIFHVDGSSIGSAERSFANIARLGHREPNFKAGKYFLANAPYSWLLIIDGVDDEAFPIAEYFPAGDRGCVLITTRKYYFIAEGTTSPQGFTLKLLEEEEAKDVLLKASNRALPGALSLRRDAGKVAFKLDYFPVALVQAGKTIRKFRQTMTEYLGRFEKASRNQSLPGSPIRDTQDKEYLVVYWSNQTSYGQLKEKSKNNEDARNAIELLQTFAFFHNEHIPTAVLFKAAETYVTRKPPAMEGAKLLRLLLNPIELSQLINAKYQFSTDKTGDVLPSVLKGQNLNGNNLSDEDKLGEIRENIQRALNELEEISFITYNENRNNFRIHNLVHRWMREGRAMELGLKAYWCQAALNVLANAVPLPSFDKPDQEEADEDSLGSDIFEDYDDIGRSKNGQTADDDPEDFRRKLFDHIRTAREMHGKLTLDMIALRKPGIITSLKAPLLKPRTVPSQIITMARFSLVYANCSHWKIALQLQEKVCQYLGGLLPRDHELNRRVSLLLAQTYWELSEAQKALKLQKYVAEACERERGPDDVETLQAMDLLGSSYWLAGQLTPAIKYHEKALTGWKKIDKEDPRVFKTMGNLGRDYMRFMNFDRSSQLFSRSLKGLIVLKGETDDDTLEAKENVAVNAVDSWEYSKIRGSLEQAFTYMEEVYQRRKKRLGREHSRTLLSSANFVKVMSAMGKQSEAEELARESIDIAARNLGPEHFGTLWGRSLMAQIKHRTKRYDEAEAENLDILAIHGKNMADRVGQDHHPDEVFVGRNLALVYEAQGRRTEAFECYREALNILESLLVHGYGHPMTSVLRKDMARVDPSVEMSKVESPVAETPLSLSGQTLFDTDTPTNFTFRAKELPQRVNTFPM